MPSTHICVTSRHLSSQQGSRLLLTGHLPQALSQRWSGIANYAAPPSQHQHGTLAPNRYRKIPPDLVIKPCCVFFTCQHSPFWSLVSTDRGEREALWVCLTEFADTCCAHHTACFLLQSVSARRRRGGVELGQRNDVFHCGLAVARAFKSIVMLLRANSGGDRLNFNSFEQHKEHFKEHFSAASLLGCAFVKSYPFLDIIWGFVNVKAEGEVVLTQI